jgi:hypothetical protein
MLTHVTRRDFLTISTRAIAALAIVSPLKNPAMSRSVPTGPVYGRTGPKGIAGGTITAPSRGQVILLDGRMIVVSHVSARGIEAGRSVFLSPEEGGRWSILYAEC